MKELENPRIESKVNSFVEKGNELHDDKNMHRRQSNMKKPGVFCLNQNQNGKLLTGFPQIYSALILTLVITMRQKMGRNDVANERVGDRYSAIDLGMVCYELEQFDEAYKYFNDAYSYGKREHLKVDLRSTLSFFK